MQFWHETPGWIMFRLIWARRGHISVTPTHTHTHTHTYCWFKKIRWNGHVIPHLDDKRNTGIISRFDDHWSVLQLCMNCNLLSGAILGHPRKEFASIWPWRTGCRLKQVQIFCSPECKELKSVSSMLISMIIPEIWFHEQKITTLSFDLEVEGRTTRSFFLEKNLLVCKKIFIFLVPLNRGRPKLNCACTFSWKGKVKVKRSSTNLH